MRAPYTYTLQAGGHNGELLDSSDPLDTTLADAERAGHMQAWEWLNTGLVDQVCMIIKDGAGKLVRQFSVYDRYGTGLANSVVRERVQ